MTTPSRSDRDTPPFGRLRAGPNLGGELYRPAHHRRSKGQRLRHGAEICEPQAAGGCTALQKAGFHIHGSGGLHVHLKHPERPGGITVPHHGRFDLPKHIVKSIGRQAGLTTQDFLRLLGK